MTIIFEMFDFLTESLIIAGVAATPVLELRGSIPLGVFMFGWGPIESAILSFFGNLLPIFLVYWLAERWIGWTERRQGFLHRLTDGVLNRSRRRLAGKYAKYGLLALPLFVAVPLPMTGAWTGAIAAFLFGLTFHRAFPYLASGVAVAAVVVTLITTGALAGLEHLLIIPE
ncbi:COG2426 family protein [Patescibacteria group bacterium]